MPTLFQKLNLKDQTELLVLNAPASFEAELAALKGVNIHRKLSEVKAITFALLFVTKQKEVDTLAAALAKKAQGDAVVWFAYPKGTSKNYKCEFNRDTGWAMVGEAGFEPVRMVAIDADWSALRFRRMEFIKDFKRGAKNAISPAGKAKAETPKAKKTKTAELKTKPTTVSVADFIASQPDAQTRADCEQLVRLMQKATGSKPRMWGTSIVGFGDAHYKYASGREGDWFQMGFSPRKQNLTLYLAAGFAGYDALLQKLGKHSTGKACLYVKRLADVDLPTLKTLIDKAATHSAAG